MRSGTKTFLAFALFYAAFFSPVLLSGRLLAPGDGINFGVPAFCSPKASWTDRLYAGYPAAADPQTMTFYPPAALFSLAGAAGWNAFVVSAYALASALAFGYARALTGSRAAGAVAGLVYGASGFMMAHLGHANMVHAAAWLPLLVWSLEELRRGWDARWFAAAAAAIGLMALAGHPQVLAYSLALAAAYVLARGRGARGGFARYAAAALGAGAAGAALGAVQLLPALELARLGVRPATSFADFTSYALPPAQAPALLFPFMFGGAPETFYGAPYAGVWNLGELAGYVGLGTLALAGVGLVDARRRGVAWFWLAAGAAALLVALGGATPLARVLYHVPPFGYFRAPARAFVVLALAASALAGLGADAVARRRVGWRGVAAAAAAVAALMLAALAASRPASTAAIAVPLAVFAAGAIALCVFARRPSSRAGYAVLLVALAADLASFGWFLSWRFDAPPASLFAPPEPARRYGEILRASGQRLAPARGVLAATDEMRPNLSRLWGVPSASGYGPLVVARYGELARVSPDGIMSGEWADADDATLDALAVRYVTLPGAQPRPVSLTDRAAVMSPAYDLKAVLGSGCDVPHPTTATFALPVPVRAARVAVVGSLACSTSVPDGAEVARVTVAGAGGTSETVSIVAGRDVSEWAWDCSDVRPVTAHGRAEVYDSFPATRDSGETCQGHLYVAALPLARPLDASRVEIAWTGPSGTLAVRSILLVDEAGASRAVAPLPGGLADASRWRRVEDAGGAAVYENLRARPRVWLVSETVRLGDADALAAIRTSRLPDGRAFDVARAATAESYGPDLQSDADASASAEVVSLDDTTMDVRTRSSATAFLVTSDAWYPGWTATVDGAPAEVFRADYALRGVGVPAGEHTVRFAYRPRSLYAGAAVSLLALLALALALRRPL